MEGDGVRVFTNEELEGIVLRYKDMVYRVAFTHTRGPTEADDVFQEVFLRLVRREEPFASEEHLKAWLLRLTIHCACDLHRTAWARRVTSYDEALDKGDGGISESSAWMGGDGPEDELREATLEAVRSLPETLRSAVYLFYYEQMSVAETARTLGIQQNAVKTRLSRARAKLKKALGAVRYAQE